MAKDYFWIMNKTMEEKIFRTKKIVRKKCELYGWEWDKVDIRDTHRHMPTQCDIGRQTKWDNKRMVMGKYRLHLMSLTTTVSPFSK